MQTIEYKDYISEHEPLLIDILRTPGKKLVIAPTGGGKTYSIIEACKKINDGKVYIMACPNRVQNEQNRDDYKIFSLIGGVMPNSNTKVVSMVYDKAKDVIDYYINELKKEVVLIVDEAHKKILDNDYRKKALNNIKELEGHCKTIIHVTGTPSVLLSTYRYDSIIEFTPLKDKGIDSINIIPMDGKIIPKSIDFIEKQIKDGIPLVEVNNKTEINKIKSILTEKGYKVGIVSKENDPIYNSIVNNSLLPNGYNVFLSTSLIECGTNINNENIIPIVLGLNVNGINTDNIIQFISRARKGIKESFVLTGSIMENIFRSRKSIESEFNFRVNGQLNNLNNNYVPYCKYKYNGNNKILIEKLKEELNSTVPDVGTTHKGCIYLDEENLIYYIDEEQKQRVIEEEFQRQYFNNPVELKKALESYNKANKVNCMHYMLEANNSTVEAVKKEKGIQKEVEKFKKEMLIKHLEENKDVIEDILNESLSNDMFTGNQVELRNLMANDPTTRKLVKTAITENVEFEKVVNILQSTKKEQEIFIYQLSVNRLNNEYRNKLFDEESNLRGLTEERKWYIIHRRIFDSTMKQYTYITDVKLMELYQTLLSKKWIKEKDFDKAIGKLYQNLHLIYMITDNNRITGLKK